MSENKNIENSSKDEEKIYKKLWFWIIILTIFWIPLIFFIWYSSFLIFSLPDIHLGTLTDIFKWENFNFDELSKNITNENKEIWSSFKNAEIWDAFNILNSLFTGFSLLFSIIATILVYFTYRTQAQELKETKIVLKNQEKEMQEQNRQQYIKFLLEQKNEILKNLNFREQKWIEIFYEFRRNFNNTSSVKLLIWFIWIEGFDKIKNNLWLFESFYKKYHWALQNYKKLCQHTEFEFKKSKNTENLAYLAITPEEQFCFDLMNWFDEYWKKQKNKNPSKP